MGGFVDWGSGLTSTSSVAATVTLRPADPGDLGECATIWRTAINDYIGRLGQADIPPEVHPVTRLFAHLQATDPELFVVASVSQEHRRTGDAAAGERIVAFGSAIVRERLWYLSMLFVLPEFQGAGLGRDVLARLLPADDTMARATATDSVQPISNAIYATLGLVPRLPRLRLVGLPRRPEGFG